MGECGTAPPAAEQASRFRGIRRSAASGRKSGCARRRVGELNQKGSPAVSFGTSQRSVNVPVARLQRRSSLSYAEQGNLRWCWAHLPQLLSCSASLLLQRSTPPGGVICDAQHVVSRHLIIFAQEIKTVKICSGFPVFNITNLCFAYFQQICYFFTRLSSVFSDFSQSLTE